MTALTVALGLLAAADVAPTPPAISIVEIEKTLHAIDDDRTSGREGERRAAAFLEDRLRAYGVRHERYEVHAWLSWPRGAELHVAGEESFTPRAVTPSFGASTAPGGVTAAVVFLPPGPEDDTSPIREDVRGRIVVASGLISPESAWRAQQAGAVGLVHVNGTDVLHEMTATTIWGTPTTESAARIPAIPVVSIGRTDGERLRAAAERGATARLVADVERGWVDIPLVMAEVPGRSPDFVLVATHLDAWYRGMTDTAGTIASILEMARALQARQGELARGVRFAWWPGHSFGRYAGSTSYADRFWSELDRHAVAYTNLDGAGRRGSRMDAVEAGGWPGLMEWSRETARAITRKEPLSSPDRIFRPGRDSDSAFQGLGVPEFFVGVPGPPEGHPDVEPSGLISYWHTAEDTLDKLDLGALELDTKYRVAQIYDLATRVVLPHRIGPIAAAYASALDELSAAAGAAFDLSTTRTAAARLGEASTRLDAAARPSGGPESARLNALLVRLTHRLNSRLYTRSGRFDQDWAAALPVLPLLARARELPGLPAGSNTRGFLETELVRGRNAVEATLGEATDEIEAYLAGRAGATPRSRSTGR